MDPPTYATAYNFIAATGQGDRKGISTQLNGVTGHIDDALDQAEMSISQQWS
jgi:hypothetical protein